ncbi:MAG: sugar kinase [Deltaproteobacteria bacterium]|nr:sugar kinase [Deltaproteobacteria bacterium]
MRLHATGESVVVGMGQASIDYLGRVSFFPAEDEKMELTDIEVQCGGPASTALVALSRLGVKTSFLGAVSDDLFGIEIVKGLKEEGVDAAFLKIRPGYTSQFAFIAITRENGKRTVFWHRGSTPPLRREEVDLSLFPIARVLHLDGLMMEASLEAARQAKKRGMKVVLDAGTFREGSLDLLSRVDIVIASERFAVPLVGKEAPPEDALEALCRLGPEQTVITLGPKGSVGLQGGKLNRQEAIPVHVVDTTGAGDVYHGAYLYGVLQDWSMSECMRFASVVAAMKCRHVGARKGIPRMEEILSYQHA